MTVAAYDGVMLVVDGSMSWGNQPMEMMTPKVLICGAWAIAMAGETPQTLVVHAGLKGVAFDEDTMPVLPPLNGGDPKFEALAVSRNRMCIYLKASLPLELVPNIMAVGSGCELAMGAMAHGANALDAVRIAVRHDIQCRPPIYIYQYDLKLGQWDVNRFEN